VVSVEEKSGRGSRQVWIKKTSASEPLLRCRNFRVSIRTEVLAVLRDKSRGNLLTAWVVLGIKAA
jgi:hypothetical protein